MEGLSPFKWSIRVRRAQGTEHCYSRNHTIRLGKPLSFDTKDEYPTALEAALSALASDLLGTFQRQAMKKRITVDALEASLVARLENPLTAIGVVGENGSPALEHIFINVYVASPAPAHELRELFEEAKLRSPLVQTLQKACALDLRLVITQ